MEDIYIHPHALKHGLTEDAIVYAWNNFISKRHRAIPNTDQIIAAGYDRSNHFIQMVGVTTAAGLMIYHAMTPPTTKFLIELGLKRR